MDVQRSYNSQNHSKKHKVEGFTLQDFRTHETDTVDRTAWYWHKDKNIDSPAKFWKTVVDEDDVGLCAEIYNEDAILR